MPDIFTLIIRQKKIVIAFTFIFLLFSIIYNFKTPEKYISYCTFYTNEEITSASNSILSDYSSLLGSGKSSLSVNNFIFAMIDSKKVQHNIIKIYMDSNKLTFDEANRFLKLNKRIFLTFDSNNTYKLSYYHENKEVPKHVINLCIDLLKQLNKEFKFSSNTNLIQVIDYPVIPDNPFRPNKQINIVLGIVLGLSIGVLITILRQFFRS